MLMKRNFVFKASTMCFFVLALAAWPEKDPALAGETAIEAWSRIIPPPVPALEGVAAPAGRTALLVLDMQHQTCNVERRPRCLDTVAAVVGLVGKARDKGVPVVFSLIRNGRPEDIFPEMGLRADDPVVASSVDKFLGTDMEKILRDRGVTAVVVTGTAAHGAVLHTATAAAQRGFSVIVPVDGISAEDLYTEAAALWCLATGPASRGKVTLTTSDRISF